jgi:prepilin-type N-terminal cleavage/methylation domain-containing protein
MMSAPRRVADLVAAPSIRREARGPRAHRRAFTLIELMVVIGLVAIIMAAGIPPFARAMRKEGLRKAVSDVVEGCSHARAQAILHGTPTELVIRAQDGQLSVRQLPRHNSDGPGSRNPFLEEEPVQRKTPGFTAKLPDDIAVLFLDVNFQDHMASDNFTEARVRFYPNGTSDEFTIILSSLSAEQKISLEVVTGLTRVEVIR